MNEMILNSFENPPQKSIWLEMGQFSHYGDLIGEAKNLKIGQEVKVKTSTDDIETCIIYEWGKNTLKPIKKNTQVVVWAIPTSEWWKD